MLLTNDQKKTIEEWVMENMKENLQQAIIVNINNKKIRLFVHLDRSESQYGTYEAPWEPNIEGLKIWADDLGIENVLEKAIEYARSLISITHNIVVPRDMFGGTVKIVTLDKCSKKDFENAIEKLMPYIWGYGNKNGPELPEEIN